MGAPDETATLRSTPPPATDELPTVATPASTRAASRDPAPEVVVETARPAAEGGASGSATSSVAQTTAAVALQREEATRASSFGRAAMLLCLAGLGARFAFPGTHWLRHVHTATLVAFGCVSAWVWLRARTPGGYDVRTFRVFGVSALLASIVFGLYVGVFSPVPVVLGLGISFFGLGDDRRFSIGASSVAILAYFVLATSITMGVLEDPGLFSSAAMPLAAKLNMATMVTFILCATLWQARASRRATYEAIERSNEAMRLMRQREAQLAEANAEVDRVLRAGAGREGRYSGRSAGPYLLEEVVGRGAMGEVYAGTHVDTGARVAVKLLHPSVLVEPASVQRFLREATIAARLRAPNVVTVHEVGEADGGMPFIAMELLSGHDLAWHLRQSATMPIAEVVRLLREICGGLAAAHENGIVHRDLKPQNLFLAEREDRSSVWKILDFGVSKIGEGATLTQGALVGTPGYMAPEQARGGEIDRRADVFALGAVAYRALTGRPAFSGNDMPQVLFDIVYKTPVRPTDIAPRLPEDIDLAIAVALAKRPNERFATAAELADAMAEAARGELGASTRARAERLIEAAPWGQRPRPAE